MPDLFFYFVSLYKELKDFSSFLEISLVKNFLLLFLLINVF